jgi:hypothetical protein
MPKYGDLKFYQPEEISKNYVILIHTFDILLGDIQEKKTNERTRILKSISERTRTELIRLLELTDTGIKVNEKYAWPARNIYELLLYTKYVLSSENNVRSFSKQVYLDEKELIEGYESLLPEVETDSSIEPIKQHLNERLHRLTAVEELPRSYKLIAEAVELQDRYTAFYKLFSKFVHPTPWLLLKGDKHVNSEPFRKIILMTAEQNALDILNSVDRAIND